VFELAAYGTNIVTLRLGDRDRHRHTDGRGVGSHAVDLPQGR
jgi:hypothetical protein